MNSLYVGLGWLSVHGIFALETSDARCVRGSEVIYTEKFGFYNYH